MNYHEIEACVTRAKSGNKEELLKILEQYKAYIFKTARTFNIKNHEIYDLVQIGNVALINAIDKYRTGSNSFSTYAYRSIENAFKYTARQNSKYSNDLSLNVAVHPEDKDSVELIDCLAADIDMNSHTIRLSDKEEVKRAVSRLPKDDIELIHLVYYKSVPLKTYAEKKGITYVQALRKRDQILEKLSRYIKKQLN
jgi:RNA polymerase sporulation-specific sigma factor